MQKFIQRYLLPLALHFLLCFSCKRWKSQFLKLCHNMEHNFAHAWLHIPTFLHFTWFLVRSEVWRCSYGIQLTSIVVQHSSASSSSKTNLLNPLSTKCYFGPWSKNNQHHWSSCAMSKSKSFLAEITKAYHELSEYF